MKSGHAIVREGRMALLRIPRHLCALIDALPDSVPEAMPDDLLMDYLLGQNTSRLPVPLSAPVEQSADDDWQLTEKAAPVRFDFPPGASIGHYPQPTDSRVRLQTVPEACSATIWFAGEPSAARVEQQANRLRGFIACKGFCELSSPDTRGLKTEPFGPFAAFTRLSIPVSNWRPRGGSGYRRATFRKPVAAIVQAPMTP